MSKARYTVSKVKYDALQQRYDLLLKDYQEYEQVLKNISKIAHLFRHHHEKFESIRDEALRVVKDKRNEL